MRIAPEKALKLVLIALVIVILVIGFLVVRQVLEQRATGGTSDSSLSSGRVKIKISPDVENGSEIPDGEAPEGGGTT